MTATRSGASGGRGKRTQLDHKYDRYIALGTVPHVSGRPFFAPSSGEWR